MREMVQLAVRLTAHEAFQPIIAERIEPTDPELASDEVLNEYLLREVTTGQHISGTCKMGPASDAMAVVDQYGKVQGSALPKEREHKPLAWELSHKS